jgi:superfamily I DNA and/or RNA helicase
VAAGGAARNLVLLGDPQQLDQVLQGSHPSGADRSALGHFLGTAETVPPKKGVFLGQTWRMHPEITAYTSELFYEGKLSSVEGLERQRVEGIDSWAGSGLRWLPVAHDGNTNASSEEAEEVVEIVTTLLKRGWNDADGAVHAITANDIRVVSPFNAHRLLIDDLLRKAGIGDVQVGTVDKFQGQQAAVSIYTMATSRPEDAPRGLEFLYSLNRLNVATSRAKALAIVVASPELLRAVPKTPDQLRMVNGLCAFVERATHVAQ